VKTLLGRGFLGTEMVVSELKEQDIPILMQYGCVMGDSDGDQQHLFLPATCDLLKVQNFLFEKQTVLLSINRRAKSMEELLYHNSDAGVL